MGVEPGWGDGGAEDTASEAVGIYVPGGYGRIRARCHVGRPARWRAFGRSASASLPGVDGKVSEGVLAVAGLLGRRRSMPAGGTTSDWARGLRHREHRSGQQDLGPGNDYVIAAKLEVFGVVDRCPAGADATWSSSRTRSLPERVASDLMAQAEHLSGASSVLLSPSEELVEAVEPLLSGEPAEHISLVRVRDLAQAAEISNHYAPEHAHVISEDWEAVMNDLREVGMVGVGDFSPIALSDYAAGPSHVLPTDGTAAWASPQASRIRTNTNYMHFNQNPKTSPPATLAVWRGSKSAKACGAAKELMEGRMHGSAMRAKTGETSVRVRLDLDGEGKDDVYTGFGTSTTLHMIDQTRAGIAVEAEGDTWVDDHNTGEDHGARAGRAFDENRRPLRYHALRRREHATHRGSQYGCC